MKNLLLFAFVTALFAGCLKNDQKCEYNECGIVAPSTETQSVQAYLSANNIVATQHCSGMFYAIDQEGSGTRPTACSSVAVYYEGRLTNGTVFDKTTTQPANFGLNGLIAGFKNGLLQLKSGGKIRLFIPPSLGYGASQVGSIPPNSILIFTVDLVAVQ